MQSGLFYRVTLLKPTLQITPQVASGDYLIRLSSSATTAETMVLVGQRRGGFD